MRHGHTALCMENHCSTAPLELAQLIDQMLIGHPIAVNNEHTLLRHNKCLEGTQKDPNTLDYKV